MSSSPIGDSNKEGCLVPSWVETRQWSKVVAPPFDSLPASIECRSDGRTAVLALIGTDKVVGFVPTRFDPSNLPALVARLREE